MPKYKATAYIRLSYTDDHSSESDSVSNQRKLIENFVERNPDIEVVSEKIDDGYSGIIFDRPAFKEMMQDVTDGNINCVIVKDLSRLGREYIETGRYLRRVFPAYGVRFIAITDSIDTAHDSGDDLTVSVKNIMNEAYCRDISIKTRSSLDVKRRNGDFVGAFPVYGYMKAEDNKNLLVPDPYAARVVCDIFRMRLEGASASKIASELNRLGILSPLAYKKNNGLPYAKKGYADKADCKWSATTIIRILQDETYTGTLVQGKQGTPHYTKSNLNVCYAAPRSARKPRDWYETQFTVSTAVRCEPDGTPKYGYPQKNVPFVVITDDGYTFKCHTTSQNNKQFSAVGDELILGRWLKGRLVAAGLVTPVNDTSADHDRQGMITKEMLDEYGCNSLLLTKTDCQIHEDGNTLDVWLLSFKEGPEDEQE